MLNNRKKLKIKKLYKKILGLQRMIKPKRNTEVINKTNIKI